MPVAVLRWLRGVDLFPSQPLIPRNLLILQWSGMPRKATKASSSFSFHSVFVMCCSVGSAAQCPVPLHSLSCMDYRGESRRLFRFRATTTCNLLDFNATD